MKTESANIFSRHQHITLTAIVLIGTALILLATEWSLRAFGNINIHYYTGFKSPGIHNYPYGHIPINKNGCPDEEFVNEDSRRRIGYVGDSVAYGVGAGYGYRVPDILQEAFPQYHHWVCANVGDYLDEERLFGFVADYQLDSVIYLMNLNDILPVQTIHNEDQSPSWVRSAKNNSWLGWIDGELRGQSHVYTYARLGLKNMLQRRGYEAHGFQAFELFPTRNRQMIEDTAERTAAALRSVMRRRSIQGCIVVLPYEMQVSRDATRRYQELGFTWEEGFEAGSTQKILIEAFDRYHVNAFDARQAFKDQDLKVGDAFVYDKGDKIDWNHPNRLGHAIIAAWMLSKSDFVSKCIHPAP